MGEATGLAGDVTDAVQVESCVTEVIDKFGRLDALVNNAGRSSRGNALETSPDEFRALWEANFLSTVHGSMAACPHLVASKGHLVNIGSLASKSSSKFLGAYPASKFAVAAYSQQLRQELSEKGVHVLLVCPGPIARQDAGTRYDDQTQDLPESARRPGGGVRLKGIPPDRLAGQILRACEHRKAELIVPAKARLLFALSQLSPKLGDWIVRRISS